MQTALGARVGRVVFPPFLARCWSPCHHAYHGCAELEAHFHISLIQRNSGSLCPCEIGDTPQGREIGVTGPGAALRSVVNAGGSDCSDLLPTPFLSAEVYWIREPSLTKVRLLGL